MTLTYDLSGNDLVVNSISTGAAAGAAGTLVITSRSLVDNQNQVAAASYAVSHTIYVEAAAAISTYKIAAVTATFGTASSSGTLQVEVATGTQAVGSGTVQLTGTISLAGTANTPVAGTVIAAPTAITGGSRVNLIFAGTVTSLANCSIVVYLTRVT